MENIYAFTPPGLYPEYISVNKSDNGEVISVTVRSPPDNSSWGQKVGTTAAIVLSAAEAKQLAENILREL